LPIRKVGESHFPGWIELEKEEFQVIRDQVNFKNPPSHPAKHGQGQSTILTAPTPYMLGLTILTLRTLRHTARLIVLTSTSSFSISSENDETVNANSGHVSWLLGGGML
jgi:hypothetical protein